MARKPWYAFLDGPRDSRGARIPFSTPGAALRWLLVMLGFACLWIVPAVILLVLGTRKAVVLGFLAVLAPSAGPLVLAALIASFHAGLDLTRLLSRRRTPGP